MHVRCGLSVDKCSVQCCEGGRGSWLKFPDLLDLTPFSFALSDSCFPFLSTFPRILAGCVLAFFSPIARGDLAIPRRPQFFFLRRVYLLRLQLWRRHADPSVSIFTANVFPRTISDPVSGNADPMLLETRSSLAASLSSLTRALVFVI